MKATSIAVVAVCTLGASAPTLESNTPPTIDSQITFLYYKDVDAASRFYHETLGLENTFDEGWVKIYRVSSTAEVGLVDETRGFHRVAEQKPVMLSIVTSEIEAWYDYLRQTDAKILSELSESGDAPIRAFLVEDPGGYTVEFFQWR